MKIGLIGCGNMGSAILKGILAAGAFKPTELIASAQSEGTRNKIKNEYNITLADSNQDVVRLADIVFLAVKPHC